MTVARCAIIGDKAEIDLYTKFQLVIVYKRLSGQHNYFNKKYQSACMGCLAHAGAFYCTGRFDRRTFDTNS